MNANPTCSSPLTFSPTLFSLSELLAPERRASWEGLLETYSHPNSLYQSPGWFEHKQATGSGDKLFLVGLTDGAERLAGLVPLAQGQWNLDYSLKALRVWRTKLRCLSVLGSVPLVPPDTEAHDRVFRAIHDRFPRCDCLMMRMVPTDSFLWRYLNGSSYVKERFAPYVPDGRNTNHFIALPDSFDAYLNKFGPKKRYNLKRQVRLLRDHAAGQLTFRRIERGEDVPFFLNAADGVARRSWQGARAPKEVINADEQWHRELLDLAERGLLRSYVLLSGHSPCAYVLGYQAGHVYHYVQIGYDQNFSRFSPGTVLLYLLIEDLIIHHKPGLVTFGFGDNAYKQQFGNVQVEGAHVILLKKNLLNGTRRLLHSSFRRVGSALRRQLGSGRWLLASARRLVASRSSAPSC
jgi:hypothetical protein